MEQQPQQNLDAVYFDTPGQRLARHHITLRRRSVMWCRANRWPGVSKYTASKFCCGCCSTRATTEIPSKEGLIVASVTSNFRSTSTC
ncbi:adenylate cyclase [Mycobacteroides abscessus subsp. abscessus]|nr:adenylate cyclase [Mycobacteroides abscessus subsp. abscessus]